MSAGQHTVTLDITRAVGSGTWYFSDQNLSAVFVLEGRGVVTDTAF